MRHRKKGYILITVILFSIISLTMVAMLFTSITSSHKIVAAREAERIKAYYATVNGLRYGVLLLNDPVVITALWTSPYTVIKSLYTNYRAVYDDLGLEHDVIITITKSGTDYLIAASYNY